MEELLVSCLSILEVKNGGIACFLSVCVCVCVGGGGGKCIVKDTSVMLLM